MSARALFVSDLHGREDRYRKLLDAVAAERPDLVFLGGDLLPNLASRGAEEFLLDWLAPRLVSLRALLGGAYPRLLAILGNDDPGAAVPALAELETQGLLEHAHGRRLALAAGYVAYGYACVPPTPFRLKDWERYDVSRFVDHGCVSPEEGERSVAVDEHDVRWGTIAGDLERLAGEDDVSRAVFLFHAPPYGGTLDRAALDTRTLDSVPLDVHVGSIAVRRFLERRQPLVSLHGHVHESPRLAGGWSERIGRTVCLSAAHDGDELALVRFDLGSPAAATRELL